MHTLNSSSSSYDGGRIYEKLLVVFSRVSLIVVDFWLMIFNFFLLLITLIVYVLLILDI